MSRAAHALRPVIEPADLAATDVRTLIAEHWQAMADTSPGESMHGLDIDALDDPAVRVRTARLDGALVGMGALVDLGDRHGELKSMRTVAAHARRGVASRLLDHLIAEARAAGFARLSLETGAGPTYAPARDFYAHHGFIPCPPFGAYQADPASVFMTRVLDDETASK